MNDLTCSMPPETSAGSMPPRASTQAVKQFIAAFVASPLPHGTIPFAAAVSPAAAISANRPATRLTWPSAFAGRQLVHEAGRHGLDVPNHNIELGGDRLNERPSRVSVMRTR